jgi:hypothetical protein
MRRKRRILNVWLQKILEEEEEEEVESRKEETKEIKGESAPATDRQKSLHHSRE